MEREGGSSKNIYTTAVSRLCGAPVHRVQRALRPAWGGGTQWGQGLRWREAGSWRVDSRENGQERRHGWTGSQQEYSKWGREPVLARPRRSRQGNNLTRNSPSNRCKSLLSQPNGLGSDLKSWEQCACETFWDDYKEICKKRISTLVDQNVHFMGSVWTESKQLVHAYVLLIFQAAPK